MAQNTVVRPPYVETLTNALATKFPGAEIDVEAVRGDRYRFIVIWAGFDAMGHPERQDLVWDLTDAVLDKESLRKVTMILTLGREDLPGENDDAE